MINKKGSHVSFAIAFMLFVGFIIFFLAITKPVEKVDKGKDFLLESLQNRIIDNVSIDLEIISVNQSGCNGPFLENEENNIWKIYKTNNSQISLSGCSVGLRRKEKYISAQKVQELNEMYNSSYENLKDYFDIPKKNDFSFGFIYENGTKIENDEKNPPTEVFAKLIPINYFNKNLREEGYLKIMLW